MSLLLIVALFGLTFMTWARWGPGAACVFGFILTAGALRMTVVQLTDGHASIPTSMAPPDIKIASYQFVVLVALLIIPAVLTHRHLPLSIVAATGLFLAIAWAQDDLTVPVASGILAWLFAGLAWAVGSYVGSERARGRLSDRFLAVTLTAAIAINAAAAALQLAGLRVIRTTELGGSVLDRVSGLADSSGNFGKVLILLIVLLLPLTRSSDHTTARLAGVSTAVAFVLIGLSYSRANMLACVVALVMWYVFGPGGSALSRIGVPALVGLVAIPFVQVLVARNSQDPSGGLRPELAAAAHEQLSRTFWWGIGANDYKLTVGAFSRVSLSLPVHNSFMLALVEGGIFVALLLAVPFVVVIIRALRSLHRTDAHRLQAVALLAAMPGLFVIAITGHGLVGGQVMALLFFVCGFCSGYLRTPVESGSPDIPGVGVDEAAAGTPTRRRGALADPGAAGTPSVSRRTTDAGRSD
jgi:hypothetical protein